MENQDDKGVRENKKPPQKGGFCNFGGERGIRTPGPFRVNGFQDRRFRPLSHLSRALQHTIMNIFCNYLSHMEQD